VSPLLNYTTTVAAPRTIGQVHAILVEAGARQIMTTYSEIGEPTGIAFAIETAGGSRAFKLPIQADRVLSVLKRDPKVRNTKYATPEQAERVAWRIAKDWLEAQLAIVRTEMVTFEEVMLPYMRTEDGRTVYELYVDNELAPPALSAAPPDKEKP
jgi:hypothetical protein